MPRKRHFWQRESANSGEMAAAAQTGNDQRQGGLGQGLLCGTATARGWVANGAATFNKVGDVWV